MITVNTGEGPVNIRENDIAYAVLKDRSVEYHLKSGASFKSVTIRGSFKAALEPAANALRMCGCSLAVNLSEISEVGDKKLIMKSGEELYVSARALKELKAALI